MCGIAGLAVTPGANVSTNELRAMGETLRHRGPDDEGYLLWSPGSCANSGKHPDLGAGSVGLVHRRLSILDLSDRGWQPMATPDGRYHLIYNGEVYNYIELRAELEREGRRFASHSDTEVVLAALAHWGLESAIPRFEGMFAFGLLDTHGQTLALARDPFGIKPLFYTMLNGRFAFASEIKALLTLPWVPRRANPKSILAYLAVGRSEHGEETAFEGIRQLPPSGVLVLDLADTPRIIAQNRSWAPPTGPTRRISRDESTQLVRDAFIGNVQRHLRSDVPVGAALSGGLDSSSIVAVMRRVAPELDLHAFSYVADDPTINEAAWVRMAALATDARVHEVTISPDELARDVDSLIRVQDEPFASTSIYAQYKIFEAVRETGIRVMLDGQGADEFLGGYASFVGPQVASLFAQRRLAAAVQLASASRDRPDTRLGEVVRYLVASSVPRWTKRLVSTRVHAQRLPTWIARSWFAERLPSLRVEDQDPGHDLRAHLVREGQSSLLALLRYEDLNSMTFSIESRVPFLTTSFVELLLSLPSDFLIAADGTRKAVFRDAMRGIVPDPIIDRRDKLGFPTPERALLAGANPWALRVLEGDVASSLPCIDAAAIRARINGGPNGGAPVPLWRVLNVIRWVELFGVQVA